MPARVAMMLAERWFDKRAANKLYLGAFQAVDADGSLDEARRLWEEATRGGASAADLMPLLEPDKSSPLVKLEPVPAAAALAKATAAVKARHAADWKSARTPAKKAELAGKLAGAAATATDSAERYALWREAASLYREAADADAIVRTIDEMAQAFTIDALAMKAEALTKLGSSTSNSFVFQAVARNLIALVDEAIEAKRADRAAKLAEAARVAAARSRDAELVRQAKERLDKAHALAKP
jgi:hypothetical protein